MDTVYVAVRKRILWVGNEAFPVGNIARVSTTVVLPRIGRAVTRGVVVALVLVGVVAARVEWDLGGFAVPAAILVFALPFFAFLIEVGRGPKPALVIETTGVSPPAIIARTPEQLAVLVERIAEAINNPAAEFEVHMADVQIGDRITQVGGNNTVSKI
ncbi:DUF6232 family protein [Actinokineospora soli]|uniref:DUF6232 family protein n=1 Tax=Actinokineospora soli TaxID=1048753 RepID=A0ABW2TJB4_9PSEU